MSFSVETRVRVGLRAALAHAVVLLFAAALALPGLAQTQPPGEAEARDQDTEEITVTGSRVRRKELEVAAPIAIYTQTDIRRAGVTSIGQLLRELPSVAGQATTTQVNNGGTGTMQISLRGLSAVRTLVLLNGHRLPPTVDEGANGIAVDLNSIPTAAIERVEVLKDGASAIYGSDAVAGVVNIITRKAEGIEITGFYGDSTRGGGKKEELSIVTGGNIEDHTSWTFYASVTDEEEINAGDRSWAKTPFSLVAGNVIFLGSSAPPWGNYNVPSIANNQTLGPDYSGPADPAAGDFRDFSFFGGDSYNFAPINHQRQPLKKWNLGVFGETQAEALNKLSFLSDVQVYAEAQYTNRESEAALAEVPLAPLAFFGFAAPYSGTNFYNPFGEDINDWRRRMVEGGPRIDDQEEDIWRLLLGMRGGFGETPFLRDWNWDFYYQRGESSRDVRFGDIYNLQRVANAVGPTTGSPATNDLACVNDSANCVPLDVFAPGSVTPEMLNYITFTTNESFKAEQEIFEISFSNSELFQLPAGPLGFAFGFQYREEEGEDNPDSQVAALGDAATGTPRQPTSGGFEVKSWYGELVIPLLADMPLVESLEAEFAIRYSDYDTFGSTTDPKFGLRWRPFSDLLLRGTISTAFRGPNIGELFGGAGFSFPQTSDPCAVGPSGCADPRVTAPFAPISTQIKETQGGNDSIDAEEADIFTLGLVWTPSQYLGFLEGFSFAIDYWEYEVDNAISTLGTPFILEQCATTGTLCDKIERFTAAELGAGNASIGFPKNVDNRFDNVGKIETSGIDFQLSYRNLEVPFIPGDFNLQLDTTYTDEYDVTQPDGSVIEHAGFFRDDQDGHFAEWRILAGVDYHFGENLRISWDTRWIDDVDEFAEDLATGDFVKRTLHGRTYHDVQVAYDFEFAGLHTFQLGVDNITNKKPPFSLDGFNDNTDVRTFDTVGRFWYTRLTLRF